MNNWWIKTKRTVCATVLCLRFPFLKYYSDKNKFWQTSCWYYAVDPGWRKIALQMFEEIRYSLKKEGTPLKLFRIYDIKQKMGHLDVDCMGGFDSDIFKIVQKYEYISERTCNICGAPAFGYTKGWILPYCKKCAPRGIPIYEYGTEEDPWYGSFRYGKDGKEPVVIPSDDKDITL